jgi:group II intron reverse transcriptase/maturase
MIDYHQTKSQPITRAMVAKAYHRVKQNKGSGGIDGMSWQDLERDLDKQLYKLWNRLSSGSYFPPLVKEVKIPKKDGGVRKLGIPTILDRIAQEVVRTHLEPKVEPLFHESSFGYRRGRSCHGAVDTALSNIMTHDWVIDLDIQSFFDSIDHELMMKALEHYCKDRWVLLYVSRWLKAGIMQTDGTKVDRVTGTPQGGVVSPLLANIFLHVVFDGWMDKHHPEKPFVRYADDIVVHCKTDKQARFVLAKIKERFTRCKLKVHPGKTRIVNMRGITEEKYPRSFDFLGFTLKPYWTKTVKGHKLLVTVFMSQKSKSSVLKKFQGMELHKRRKPVEELARLLNPITRGVINYYCKLWASHTSWLWTQLNLRLTKWVMWEKGLFRRAAHRWLKRKFKETPNLFYHWKIAHP